MLDGLKEWLLGLMTSAIGGFDTMLKDATDILTGGMNEWDSVLKISDALLPFCYTIIGICLLIELAQVASKVDLIKWEHGLKLGIKMVFAKVCIDVAPTFLKACYGQAQSWIGLISADEFQLGQQTMGELTTLVNEVSGFGNILGMFVSSFIVIVAIKICGLMIQVMAYSRMFELYVYLVISPLPCAFFPLGNGDGSGISRITSKFFKNFMAVCLQGVMMIIVISIFDKVIGGAMQGVFDGDTTTDVNVKITNLIYTMLLGAIALVMGVARCGSWAKSILDAM